MSINNTHTIRGTGHWMKVLGDPVDNYSKDGKEWVLDFTPDAAGVKLLKKLKLSERLKNKDDERGDFITFRQRATKANGEANRPINVVDSEGRQWPVNNKLGNGTVCDLKFNVRDYGPGKKQGVYPQAIRVLEHVPYVPVDFAPLDEDDDYFGKAVQAEQMPDVFTQASDDYIAEREQAEPDPFDDEDEEVA